VCLSVLAISFEQNDLYSRYLAYGVLVHLNLEQVQRSRSWVKVHEHMTRGAPLQFGYRLKVKV